MAGEISFSGIATGLDSKSIIQSLLTLERRPITRLQTERGTLTSRQNEINGIRSKLRRLADSVNALDKDGAFGLYTSTSSDEEKLGVEASGSALTGSHTINITALAVAKSGSSNVGYADVDTTKFGSGSITILVGTKETTVDITANQNDTLAGIRDAINNADAGVQASTIFDGTNYKLVLNSTKTGTANAFSVSSDFSFLNEGTGFSQIRAAANASFNIDGLAVTSAENTVKDAIQGVTLTLKNTGTNLTFGVQRDKTEIGDKFQDFIDAFNDAQTALSTAGAKKDATLSNIRSRLAGTLSTDLSAADFDFTALSQIGITRDTTGKVKLDRTKLDDAIDDNFAGVVATFQGLANNTTKTGVADAFRLILEGNKDNPSAQGSGILNTGSGLLALREQSIASRIRRIDDQITVTEKRLDGLELSLTKKFANLEQLSARFQSQSGFISTLSRR